MLAASILNLTPLFKDRMQWIHFSPLAVRLLETVLASQIHLMIEKSSKSFGKLKKRAWSDRGINHQYSAQSVPYFSETWTTYSCHIKTVERFYQMFLKGKLSINWQSFTSDTIVLQWINTSGIKQLRQWEMTDQLSSCFTKHYHVTNVQNMNKNHFRDVAKNILKTPGIDAEGCGMQPENQSVQ